RQTLEPAGSVPARSGFISPAKLGDFSSPYLSPLFDSSNELKGNLGTRGLIYISRGASFGSIARLLRYAAAALILCTLPNVLFADGSEAINIGVTVRSDKPAPVLDLVVSPVVGSGVVNLTWTEPNGNLGPVIERPALYEIKVSSTGNINNQADFDSARPLSDFSPTVPPVPGTPGGVMIMSIMNLTPDTTYYFAVRAYDPGGRPGWWVRIPALGFNVDNYTAAGNLPPLAPWGLTATSGLAKITLNWDASIEYDIDFYRIYKSSISEESVVAFSTTSVNVFVDTHVVIGTTYYYKLTAQDNAGLEGSTSTAVSGVATIAPPVQIPANFRVIGKTTESITWGWDNVSDEEGYRIYSSTGQVGLVGQVGADVTIWEETGLSANIRATRVVRAFNYSEISGDSNSAFAYTLANTPLDLAVTSVTHYQAFLAWGTNGNSVETAYNVYRSTNGQPFVEIDTVVGTSTYADVELSPFTTYYYKLTATNGDGVSSMFTATIGTFTAVAPDLVPPKAPVGLYGELSSNDTIFTLYWSSVTQNVQGSTETIDGYNVYRSTRATSDFVKLTTSTIVQQVYHDLVGGTLYYYRVTAVDLSGNESEYSMTIDSGLRISAIANDGVTRLSIPAQLLVNVKEELNAEVVLEANDKDEEEQGIVFRSVEFVVKREDTGEVVTNFLLPTPEAEVVLHYSIVAGKVVNGYQSASRTPQVTQGSIDEATAAQNMGLYWNDGVKWVKLGGKVDMVNHTVTKKIAHLGHFQLRKVARAQGFLIDKSGQSHKIFTPNGDGWNDHVIFRYENPEGLSVDGKIYDLTGAYVAKLKQGTASDSIMWDGKDDSGNTVRSGIYIFQIKAGGKLFNGTVVVAR
ncbi:FlgD immunoglobulin-like domain containing protein, partial [Elusimicrobiota bacterium]